MAQSLHYFKPGQDVTAVPTANVTGATLVKITEGGTYNQPKIVVAGAGDRVFGVVARDAEKEEPVLVHTGGIVPITAGGSITAGAAVAAGDDGKAVVASGGAVVIGQAIADAASGSPVSVLLSV